MFRLEFYTAFSQLFKPDLNQQPKSAKYLFSIFFLAALYLTRTIYIRERERERSPRFLQLAGAEDTIDPVPDVFIV